jgi:hypothetical protein
MNVLHLTLKKQWFDLVASGSKKQEYREIKPYWIARFIWPEYRHLETEQLKELIFKGVEVTKYPYYEAVIFTNGYNQESPKMMVELKNIYIGLPVPKWTDTKINDVFILHLGQQLNLNTK